MSLLLSQVPPPFDPANGFPYEQPPGPPAHSVPSRATALLLAATAFVFIPPPVNPANSPTWLPDYPEFPARDRLLPVGLKPSLFKPPDQFGTAVRFVTQDSNNGLFVSASSVGPQTYSISCFFYAPTSPQAGDVSIWMLQNTTGAVPSAYHNLEIATNGTLTVSWTAGGGAFLTTVIPGRWYFVSLAVGTGGNATAYWGLVGDAALTAEPITSMDTGLVPAHLTIGTDYFDEPFDGRITGLKVHAGVELSAAEALAEFRKINPARTAGISHFYKLEHATTKLVDSSGFNRTLTAIGAGNWQDEEGPFLQAGPYDPFLNTFFSQPPAQPPLPPPRAVHLLDSGGGGDFVFSPGGFTPASNPSWLSQYPDFTRRLLRPVSEGGLFEVPRAGLGAIRLDTAADALRGLSLPINNTSYTAVGWVQYDSTTNDDSLIFVSDAAGTGLALEFKTGVLKLVDTFGFSRPASVGGTLVNGKWYFVGLRVNGTAATIYLGDETSACINSSGTIVAQGASGSVYLSYTSGNFLIGGLSRWRLYDAQLTDGEVDQERLADLALRTSNLVAAWKLASEADKFVDSFDSKPLVTTGTGTWENIRGPVLDFVSKMAWQPFFPDFARARAVPVEKGGEAPFVFTPAAAQVSLDWLPDYPDFPRRALLSALNEGGLFRTHLEYEPTTDWSPEFPDFAGRAALRPVNEGGESFANFDFVPKLAWSPSFPDFARKKPRPVDTGLSVLVIQEREPVTDWLPDYPDFARAAARPVNEGGVFRTHLEYEPTTDWAPEYPDFAGRALPRAVNEGGLAPFDNVDFVPRLAWAPSYPDFARKKQPLVNEGGEFFVKLEREPDVDWLPDFPDFPGRAAPRPVNEGGLAPFDNFDFVPKLGWSPSYPDFARSKPRPVDVGLSVIVVQEREPVTDWLPDYPDFPGRAALRATALLEFGSEFFVKVEREPQLDWVPDYPDFPARALPRAVNEGGYDFQRFTPAVVAQLWYPDYPDFAKGRQRPVEVGWLAFVKLEREPVTDWLPSFPDRVPGPQQPLNVGGYASLDNFDFIPKLGWSPDYPDFARAARRLVNTGGLFPAPPVDVAPALSWSPEYPDFARGKPRLVPEGLSVFPIQEREPIVDWLPDYPDFARRARSPVNEGGVFWTQYEYEPTTDWSPEYPDFPGRDLPRPVATGTFSFLDLDYAPSLAWSPDYPDFARAAPRPVDTGMLGYVRIFIRVPDVEWLPIMPDFIWQKAPLVQEGGTFFVKLEREPSTDWMPTFPDFVLAAPVPVNEGGQFPSEVNPGNDTIFEAGTASGMALLRGQFTILGQEPAQILRPDVQIIRKARKPKK